MDSEQLKLAIEAKVEVLQVGTRNALNYSLLKEIGRLSIGTNCSVLLKRGRHVASPNEFIAAAEYIVAEGNPNVMLCPRGTTPALDGYRNHPDESISPMLKKQDLGTCSCGSITQCGTFRLCKGMFIGCNCIRGGRSLYRSSY